MSGARRRSYLDVEPDRTGHADVPGGRIWYRIDGARHLEGGRTPLIGVHGGPGLSHHYILPLTALADERPVVLYDQLDCGASDRPNSPGNWAVDRFVSEIGALRVALGLERAIVFGNSWGGSLAAIYAADRPAGLAGVVLSSPLISTPRWIVDTATYRKALPARTRAVLDAQEAAGATDSPEYEAAVAVFMRRHFCRRNKTPPELARSFEAVNSRLYRHMWGNTEFSCSGTLSGFDAGPLLANIAAPVLFTCGEHDESTPDANRHFAAMTPGAELDIFERASHVAFLERPAVYLDALRTFFDRIGE